MNRIELLTLVHGVIRNTERNYSNVRHPSNTREEVQLYVCQSGSSPPLRFTELGRLRSFRWPGWFRDMRTCPRPEMETSGQPQPWPPKLRGRARASPGWSRRRSQ